MFPFNLLLNIAPIYPEKMNRGRSDKQFLIRVTYSKFDIFKESRDFILIMYYIQSMHMQL